MATTLNIKLNSTGIQFIYANNSKDGLNSRQRVRLTYPMIDGVEVEDNTLYIESMGHVYVLNCISMNRVGPKPIKAVNAHYILETLLSYSELKVGVNRANISFMDIDIK